MQLLLEELRDGFSSRTHSTAALLLLLHSVTHFLLEFPAREDDDFLATTKMMKGEPNGCLLIHPPTRNWLVRVRGRRRRRRRRTKLLLTLSVLSLLRLSVHILYYCLDDKRRLIASTTTTTTTKRDREKENNFGAMTQAAHNS